MHCLTHYRLFLTGDGEISSSDSFRRLWTEACEQPSLWYWSDNRNRRSNATPVVPSKLSRSKNSSPQNTSHLHFWWRQIQSLGSSVRSSHSFKYSQRLSQQSPQTEFNFSPSTSLSLNWTNHFEIKNRTEIWRSIRAVFIRKGQQRARDSSRLSSGVCFEPFSGSEVDGFLKKFRVLATNFPWFYYFSYFLRSKTLIEDKNWSTLMTRQSRTETRTDKFRSQPLLRFADRSTKTWVHFRTFERWSPFNGFRLMRSAEMQCNWVRRVASA